MTGELVDFEGSGESLLIRDPLLLEIDGLRVLTDPVWGPRASPSRFAGPKRFQPVPVPLKAMPPLDPDVGFTVGSDKDLTDPAKRKLITDLLERLGKAYAWGDAHPAQWIKDVQKETGVDQKTATIEVDNGKDYIQYVTPSIVKSEQKLADTFYKAKQITKPVNVSAIVDNVLPQSWSGK